MELTLYESANHKTAVDLFEALILRKESEDCPFPDAVFSLVGEQRTAEEENFAIYKVLISAPDDQARLANAFADGYALGWFRGKFERRRRYTIRRRNP